MASFWQENKVNIIGWAVVLLVVAAGVALAVSSNNQRAENSVVELAVRPDDNFQGPEDASVTLIEYADFQCPACAQYQVILNEVKELRGEQVKVIFRHFPLESIHPNAVVASIASEAVKLQGKFWEMHDALYINQLDWSNLANPVDVFADYAEQLGMNVEQFLSDMENPNLEARVRRDMAGAESIGVDATPTFFVNGEQARSGSLTEDLVRLIDKYLP